MEFPHFERPRSGFLLVVAAGMLAKQRRQGKRGNILLAMPQARSSMDWNFTLQNSAIEFGGAHTARRSVRLINRERARSSPEQNRRSFASHLL
jgi:hypothetical protein